MSLVREAARLPLRSCLQAVNASCRRIVKCQDSFEGVFNPFLWDETTGFGVTKGDKTVLVSPTYKRNLQTESENDVWQDIIDPTTYICHEALRDELQMIVLAYDDDVLKTGPLREEILPQRSPIYKGDVEMMMMCPGEVPGGQNAGFNGHSESHEPSM